MAGGQIQKGMGTENLKCKTCGNIELTFDNFGYCKNTRLYVDKDSTACVSHTAFRKDAQIGFKPTYINKKTNGQTGTE